MNLKKIEKFIAKFDELNAEDSLNNSEFFIFVGNMLIAFGKNGVRKLGLYKDLNLDDPFVVERALIEHPDEYFLMAILYGHIMISIANNIEGNTDD